MWFRVGIASWAAHARIAASEIGPSLLPGRRAVRDGLCCRVLDRCPAQNARTEQIPDAGPQWTHIEASAKILSDAPDYFVSGLDGPVRVRQKGERELEVFLPFQVTYGQKK